ncbi:ATPase components of ABC transporters with duplicated ATPase domains [Jatrophihabitans endophyticus]|uniref:ATPase components of ABC transporters with duplicated ATPase domains n=1 Tax=Jatrophihabitans endophyticus TaxID=1206085 RepID=A0A1M5N2R0_9ACTN|nr:ABC-F family ATP-binding cassette domain-containing protein [Jatrophihabitans endophyticus]SHG83821.1 ATPase components of ABC transporters with duplicated ATPase domains [Jatrophihabitans endophyticus]
MITAHDLELRAGARILLEPTTLRVQAGDRIGLVGRNGAGKTTSLRVLAGETLPHGGRLEVTSPVGYLPQDPRDGDLAVLARDRVLSARGLDTLVTDIAKAQVALAERPDDDALLRRYGSLEERFTALGGYAAESEAARICANLGLPDRVLAQPLSTLSGGQRRRVELARILFADSGAEPTTLLLDEPTNHLDADSITWLRDFLKQHTGGLILISHDVELLDAVVNKVWYLDANRSAVDAYNVDWKTYLKQREADEKRRVRERANAERKIETLTRQADKMRAKATKARAAHQMDRRAAALSAGLAEVRQHDKVARLRFPAPAACGKTPLTAEGLSKSYGSLEVFAGVDLAIDRGARVVVLGLNGAGKTTLLRLLSGLEPPDTGAVVPGHGLRLGYYAQEHETLDHDRTILENMRTSASSVGRADLNDTELRKILGAFLFSGDDVDKPAGVLSGGEKTRLALAMLVTGAANVLLLDEPTNNLDPVSREQVLDALHTFAGAIVLVTHDEGAVEALAPEKVIMLPDGVEDQWSAELTDLITLA